jgi:o-succinylbenzoate synthase
MLSLTMSDWNANKPKDRISSFEISADSFIFIQAMPLQAEYFKRTFNFNFKARTSRGLMRDKVSWFVKVWDDQSPDVFGIGECGPLPGLSVDFVPEYDSTLQSILAKVPTLTSLNIAELPKIVPAGYPSIMFGLETALLDLSNGGKRIIYDNQFRSGAKIPINGLIWMGDMDFTMSQINIKIYEGFRCIKLKVGGLDFDRECDILDYIRKRYYRDDITIRLDANGAFKLDDVLYKLNELSKYNIQSIEQPIKAGMEEMEELCRKSPIPVAFDEELIGKFTKDEKIAVLEKLRPHYIILKPSLHGGLQHCVEWISVAEERKIGWWITSALESNIGLNAICQFTATYPVTIPQGLGTGMIYSNNFTSPLEVEKGNIFYNLKEQWNEEEFKA